MLKFVFVICVIYGQLAFAHFPILVDRDPTIIDSIKIGPPFNKSVAFYSYLDNEKDIDVYEFNVTKEHLVNGELEILIGALIPACEQLKPLLLDLVLLGPKQKSLPYQELPQFVLNDQGLGSLWLQNTKQGKLWYESHTRHYYFWQKRKKLKVTKTGTYKVYLWSNNQMKGDYVFEFGDKEIWSFKDILYTLWIYPKLLMEGEIKTPGCKTQKIKGHPVMDTPK